VEPQREPHGLREFRRFTSEDIKQLIRMRDLVRWGYNLRAAAGFVHGHVQPIVKEDNTQSDEND